MFPLKNDIKIPIFMASRGSNSIYFQSVITLSKLGRVIKGEHDLVLTRNEPIQELESSST